MDRSLRLRVWVRRIAPWLYLANGIYSLTALQRDFQSTGRLTLSLFFILPVFIGFGLIYRWYERSQSQRDKRVHSAMHWASHVAVQAVTQYILMFCLPFFSVSERWAYLGITLVLLLSTLWNPWWSRLVKFWLYRRCIQVWSLVCATSFLFPFFWPEHLDWFYPALTLAGLLALIPGSLKFEKIAQLCLLAVGLSLINLGLPLPWRFPILSVWLTNPHFETDTIRKDRLHVYLISPVRLASLQIALAEGHSICCVAPVVAPPRLREKLQQEWTLDGRIIEAPELRTPVAGRESQQAFRTYYCKQNFPPLKVNSTLRCRIFLKKQIYLGDSSFLISE